MNYKIDCEKVSSIGNNFKSKSDELDSLYNDVLNICDNISQNFNNKDNNLFPEKFRDYIKLFKIENEDLRNGGLVLNKVSGIYENEEKDWNEKINHFDEQNRRA